MSLTEVFASIGGMNKIITMAVGWVYFLVHWFLSRKLLIKTLFNLDPASLGSWLKFVLPEAQAADKNLVACFQKSVNECAGSLLEHSLDLVTLVKEFGKVNLLFDLLFSPETKIIDPFLCLSRELESKRRSRASSRQKRPYPLLQPSSIGLSTFEYKPTMARSNADFGWTFEAVAGHYLLAHASPNPASSDPSEKVDFQPLLESFYEPQEPLRQSKMTLFFRNKLLASRDLWRAELMDCGSQTPPARSRLSSSFRASELPRTDPEDPSSANKINPIPIRSSRRRVKV